MPKLIKVGKEATKEGTTVRYWYEKTLWSIESRRVHIPHSGDRPGAWDHTTYFVRYNGKDVSKFQRLADAKEYAEKQLREGEKS